MKKIIKTCWIILGFFFIGVAYIGVITPGIPWSTPSAIAAFCFAKGSDRWHNWLMNHKIFGTFLKNWKEKRIYPTKAKWAMFIMMDISLVTLYLTTQNYLLLLTVAAIMIIVLMWAYKFPGSIEEYNRRLSLKKN
jgi:uncharacterized protein